jgi:nitrite reductase/ring-hydroxylating ferredoxin subunit/uncharacterized membrane protein
MTLHEVATRIGELEALDQVTQPLTRAAKKVIPPGPVKDVLSGTPIGHPLHPLLTDVAIGAFTGATVLDLFGKSRSEHAADLLLAVGLASAVPTAAAGWSDWSDTYGSEQRVGVVHALSNAVGIGCFAASLAARRRGHRGLGRFLGLTGITALAGGGYLGGHLSYAAGVGVNNTFVEHGPDDWTEAAKLADLPEGSPTRVDVGNAAILLYRTGEQISAIGSRCSHAGGPLHEGKIEDGRCVQCPWHGSVFRLDDGNVVHSPASVPQPAYDVRVSDGRVEVRRRRAG